MELNDSLIEKLQKETDNLINLYKQNTYLYHTIEELIKTIENSQNIIQDIKKTIDLDVEIEPKVYLKGVFNRFIEDNNSLEILINGKEYYYSLSEYQCKYLPLSGSRVFIFKDEKGNNLIYGFNKATMIEIANNIIGIIKFISKNKLKIYIDSIGYIDFIPSDDFFKNMNYKIEDNIILKEIEIEGDKYFYIANSGNLSEKREKILLILKDIK